MPDVSDQVKASLSERAAIIFVPGISRSWADHSLPAVADDLVVAFNNRSRRAHSVSAIATRAYGTGASPPVARFITLSRAGDDPAGKTEAVVDVYEFDYTRRLAERFEQRLVIVRALLVLVAIIRGVFTLRGPRGAKTFIERMQVLWLRTILALYAFLLVVLAVALIAQADELRRSVGSRNTAPTTEAAPTQDAPSQLTSTDPNRREGQPSGRWGRFWQNVRGWSENVIRFVVPFFALIWLLLPPRATLKQVLVNTATDYLAVDYYLRGQEGAEELHGGFRSLIDTLADLPYRRIDVVSYSFGSVVAFNVIFPGHSPEPDGPVGAVSNFVTIGSPFDLVRRLRPKYFTDRHALPEHPKRWFNIYVPYDVLGSNFRNDPKEAQPEKEVISAASKQGGSLPTPVNVVYLPGGVPRQPPGLADLITVRGLAVHARYWDPSQTNESTCFDAVISKLYEGDVVGGV